MLLELVRAAETERQQIAVGDGPLRDLLIAHPDTFGPRVIEEAARNPQLVECLGWCWPEGLQFNLWQWLTAFQEEHFPS